MIMKENFWFSLSTDEELLGFTVVISIHNACFQNVLCVDARRRVLEAATFLYNGIFFLTLNFKQ